MNHLGATHKMTTVERHDFYRRISAKRRATLDAKAADMFKAYEDLGRSFSAVARKFGTDKGTVKYILERNGYPTRQLKSVQRQANGSPIRYTPKTEAEVQEIIAGMTRIKIPDELRFEWRQWSMERRRQFIAQVRAKLNSGSDRPTTPFSSNVEPFDYGSPRAIAIADKMNRGRNSRTKAVAIRLNSQGVIFEDRLYFWSATAGNAYFIGPWRPDVGRPPLHHIIWERAHGPIPKGKVVRFADGNKNNLTIENLVLATRNDVARENQAGHLQRRSRAITSLLLKRSQTPNNNDTHLLSSLSAGQRAV